MKYKLYLFCKYAKFIGILGFGTLISENIIFNLLWCFWILGLVEIMLDFTNFKCAILQIIGIIKLDVKYGDNYPTADNYTSNISYSLPFKGEWVAVNGCYTKEYSHSWSIPTQRYAYDFIILDEEGKSYSSDATNVKDYYCYNQPILSPADGIVVEVVNKAEDSMIFGNGKFYSKAKHIAGNYIVIKHDEHEYSTFAHLKKDSIIVKLGDKVKKGQIIGNCGNTGNSTEPHLHFQLQNNKSFYNSFGLPILFENIKLSTHPKYGVFDTREFISRENILPGRVSRGYKVSELKIPETMEV